MPETIIGKKAIEQAILLLLEMTQGRFLHGIETGFYQLDQMLMGLKPGSLTVLASLPTQGKTAFALNMIYKLTTTKNAKRILYCTVGMSPANTALALMRLKMRTEIINRNGTINSDRIEKLTDAAMRLKDIPLWIDPSWRMSEVELIGKIRRHASENLLDLCIVDAFQSLQFPDHEITTEKFKALAEELQLPIVILYSQYGKEEKVSLHSLPWRIVDNSDTVIVLECSDPKRDDGKSRSAFFPSNVIFGE